MLKIYAKLIGIHLATGTILTLLSIILLWIFEQIWGGILGPIILGNGYELIMGGKGPLIFTAILSLVGSLGVTLFIRSWIAPSHVDRYEVDNGSNYFARRIRDKKFIHNSFFILLFIPSTIIGLIGTLLTYHFCGEVYLNELSQGWNFIIGIPFVSFSIVFLITGFGGMLIKAEYSQCPRCGCMNSFIYENTSDRTKTTYNQSKVRDITEKVGEVRTDSGEYISDINHTYQRTYNRNVTETSWNVNKYCANCGKEISESHIEKSHGSWE